jgi:hypothetical protein
MKVVRSHHRANYTLVPNSVIRDTSLSRSARSILIELLSNPSNWQHATAEGMWKWERRQRGDQAEGRLSYLRAFNELVAVGYTTRARVRRGTSLITLVTVYDTPRPGPDGSSQPGARLVPAPRSGDHDPWPGQEGVRSATEGDLDPARMESVRRSLWQRRLHPRPPVEPGQHAAPDRAGGWRRPDAARAGAERVRQALARAGVTTGGGPGGG